MSATDHCRRPAPRCRLHALAGGLLAAALLLTACAEEEAVPIDPSDPPALSDDDPAADRPLEAPDVTHSMQPTPEMEELARTQCLEDPELAEGYVKAVDAETGAIVVDVTVDCGEVRGSG